MKSPSENYPLDDKQAETLKKWRNEEWKKLAQEAWSKLDSTLLAYREPAMAIIHAAIAKSHEGEHEICEQLEDYHKLVCFFRSEGYSMFGFYGDEHGLKPCETAIHFLKKSHEPPAQPQRSEPPASDMIFRNPESELAMPVRCPTCGHLTYAELMRAGAATTSEPQECKHGRLICVECQHPRSEPQEWTPGTVQKILDSGNGEQKLADAHNAALAAEQARNAALAASLAVIAHSPNVSEDIRQIALAHTKDKNAGAFLVKQLRDLRQELAAEREGKRNLATVALEQEQELAAEREKCMEFRQGQEDKVKEGARCTCDTHKTCQIHNPLTDNVAKVNKCDNEYCPAVTIPCPLQQPDPYAEYCNDGPQP